MQLHTLVEADPQGTIGVAQRLGRSQNWVEDRLDILTWPDALIGHVHERRISLAAAKHLSGISDPVMRDLYIADAARNGISARTAAQWRASANADAAGDDPTSEKSEEFPISPVLTTTFVVCFGCRENKSIDETRAARLCNQCALELGTAPSPATHTVVQQQPTPPTHHDPNARDLSHEEVQHHINQADDLRP